MDEPRGPQDGVVFTQNIAATGIARVNAVQHGDQYNYIYRGTPPYRVESFPLADSATVPDWLARVPSRLLTARHQVVPFFPRPELSLLESWREEESLGLSVRLVHAEGGSGKTRLAAQFASRSAEAGWAVALARHRSEVASAGGGDESLTVKAPGLVVVVDYAERWPLEDLITLVRQHQEAARDRLRILLLSRTAGTWWEGLRYQLIDKLKIGCVDKIRLEALPDTPGVRTDVYVQARDRFAEIFALTEPAWIGVPKYLADPVFALTLTVHMRALVDVDAASRSQAPPTGSGQAALSSYLLDREHDYWRSSHDRGHGPSTATEQTMGRAVYVATLTRSVPPDDAAAALVRTGAAAATAEKLLEDHARCYPPAEPGLVLDPLYPDRLGEDYLALSLPGHEDEFDYHATDPWATTAPALLLTPGDDNVPAAYTRQALTVLIEAAHRWPHLTERHLNPLLRDHPALALAAGSAALTRLSDLATLDIAVLEAVEPHLPRHAHVDLDLGASALTGRLTEHRLAATTDPAARAVLYGNLGWRYGNAGLHHQALSSTQQASELHRELAQANPAAHLPGLAAALSNLGGHYAGMGLHKEALAPTREAVDIRRRLAEADPAVHLPDLATALNNLGVQLSEAGQREEALAPTREAVEIRRRLAVADPVANLPRLAIVLNSLGVQLSEVGLREEALALTREAVDTRRRLADVSPGEHLPELAMALNNLGTHCAGMGLREEALDLAREVVDIRRRLADTNPTAYLPRLAAALNNLGGHYAGMGLRREALISAREAVDIYRCLADADPVAYLPGLAVALNNLGARLAGMGLREEALAPARETVDIRRRLADANPAAYLPGLAVALNNLGLRFSQMGLREEALAPAREAVDVQRRLADANSAAHLPDLATALNNLGNSLSDAGLRREALASAREAVDIHRPLADTNPAAYLPGLATALHNFGLRLAEMGLWHEALASTWEAVDIRRRLADANPAAHLPDLAFNLLGFAGVRLVGTLQLNEALAAVEESVRIYRELAERLPDAFAANLRSALDTRSEVLKVLGHP